MTVAEAQTPSGTQQLADLTEALTTTTAALRDSEEHFVSRPDGISLLDVKNDLLLSYLQNLVFLILFKLRNVSTPEDGAQDLHDSVVKKLVELRVYLERGVRPLEAKLKYQIDSVLRAAENAKIQETRKATAPKPTTNGDVAGSDSEDQDSEEIDNIPAPAVDTSTSGPRLLQQLAKKQPTSKPDSRSKSSQDGIYRPPRNTPVSMPSTDLDRRQREPRKHRSQILNEYIDEELSSAPRAQPSIGSNNTIMQSGRSSMSTKDKEKERERIAYEEKHFTRLPAESKAERRKARARGEGVRRNEFGGEDWSGLGEVGARVSRSLGGREREGVLKRREKRRATEDGPRGDGREGVGIGEGFEKRRKVLEGRRAKTKMRNKGR